MSTSSRSLAPAGDMSFKRLNQKRFHGEHDRDECKSISQNSRDVEQLEGDPDLETDSIGSAEELHDEHYFPDQRQARAGGGGEIRRKLRQHDMTYARPSAHAENLRHLIKGSVEGARTFAYRHGCDRELVERHGGDGSGFGEPRPDVSKHDDHQGGHVEEHDEPRIPEAIANPRAAHDKAER